MSKTLDRDCGEIHWVISAGVEPPILVASFDAHGDMEDIFF